MRTILFIQVLLASLWSAAAAVPKVVLIGDSIRLSYTSKVIQELKGEAEVISPKPNGQDSANVLRNLERWVISEKPDVVHFNCGIHDTKRFHKDGHFQVSPGKYESNLRRIVEQIRGKTDATVLFATTTPIVNDRSAAARKERDYALTNEAVEQYNKIALKVMKELDVPVNDLNASLREGGRDLGELIVKDGVHMTPEAQQMLGLQVAGFIRTHLPAR